MNPILPKLGIITKKNGQGGGPYESSQRILNSKLKNDFDLINIEYDSSIGRKISFTRIKDLILQIRANNIDLVHFSGLQLEGFHIGIAAFLSKTKSLIAIRGFSGDDKSLGFMKRLIMTLIFEPLTLVLVDRFYSNSEYTSKRRLLKVFRKKSLGVIYNLQPLKIDHCKSLINIIKPHNKLKVLIVSRITEEKGFKNLSKIISAVNPLEMEFIIVGDGDYKTEFISTLRSLENIKFTGIVEDVSKYYYAADVLLHPSLHETLGNVLIEASLNKVPIIASKVGGIPEIVIHNKTGFLVEPKNISSFVQYLNLLKENLELRADFGAKAFEFVKEKFSRERIEFQLNQVFTDLICRSE
jgi:L-malate glycosyltransferase